MEDMRYRHAFKIHYFSSLIHFLLPSYLKFHFFSFGGMLGIHLLEVYVLLYFVQDFQLQASFTQSSITSQC